MRTLILKITLLLLTTVIVSACVTEKPTKSFIEELHRKETPPPYFNCKGVYAKGADLVQNNNELDSVYRNSIIFYPNFICLLQDSYSYRYAMRDIEDYGIDKYRTGYSWGVYSIEDSIIKATIYTEYYGRGYCFYHYLTNFEGRLEGKDKIKNWHRVPPYPKLSKIQKEHSSHICKKLDTPVDLQFYPLNDSLIIDSKLAWINKYKK